MATKNLDKIEDKVPYENSVAPTKLSIEEAKKQAVGEYQIYQGVKKYDAVNGTA